MCDLLRVSGGQCHTHTAMQMLAEPLRDGWAVNKKWHDMIPTAGTNQTACHSLLTFTKTPERWARCVAAGGEGSLSYVCLDICLKKCVCVFTYSSSR